MPNLAYKRRLLLFINRPLTVLLSGQIITALAGLMYGKLTAMYISPDVWGEYSLWFVAMTLVHGLFITPTLQSFKAALGQFSQKQTITFYKQLLTVAYLILSIPVLIAGLYYRNSIFGLIWIAAVGQGFYQFGSNYLNAAGQHRRYALVQTGYALSNVVAFTGIVIAINQRTANGLWQAVALINSVFAVVSVRQAVLTNGAAVRLIARTHSTKLFRTYRQYVWPLVSLAFWSWLINYADRYLIRFYLTEADVGQYGMGYSLGSKLLLVVAPLLASLFPQILQLRTTDQLPQTANVLIRPYLIQYILMAGSGCLFFYLGHDWIGRLLLSDRYKPAFVVGPTVAVGYLFLTSIHLLELKWYVFGQTRFILWHNVAGAFLNIGFSLLLIPRMGIMGAALATLLGFAGQFLLAIWFFTSTRLINP